MTGAIHKPKILIVDDDPDIAGAFSHLLQLADYSELCFECESGRHIRRPEGRGQAGGNT
jgi:hypothetical protein